MIYVDIITSRHSIIVRYGSLYRSITYKWTKSVFQAKSNNNLQAGVTGHSYFPTVVRSFCWVFDLSPRHSFLSTQSAVISLSS